MKKVGRIYLYKSAAYMRWDGKDGPEYFSTPENTYPMYWMPCKEFDYEEAKCYGKTVRNDILPWVRKRNKRAFINTVH